MRRAASSVRAQNGLRQCVREMAMELLVGGVLLWLILGAALVSVLALLRKLVVDDPPAGAKAKANANAVKKAKPASATQP
jgi:hypothetical protein